MGSYKKYMESVDKINKHKETTLGNFENGSTFWKIFIQWMCATILYTSNFLRKGHFFSKGPLF